MPQHSAAYLQGPLESRIAMAECFAEYGAIEDIRHALKTLAGEESEALKLGVMTFIAIGGARGQELKLAFPEYAGEDRDSFFEKLLTSQPDTPSGRETLNKMAKAFSRRHLAPCAAEIMRIADRASKLAGRQPGFIQDGKLQQLVRLCEPLSKDPLTMAKAFITEAAFEYAAIHAPKEWTSPPGRMMFDGSPDERP